MNIRQMQYEFGIQLNQFNEALQLTSDDILYWLNKAQERLVKDRFTGRALGVGFEQSFDLIADLQNLIERSHQIMPTYAGEIANNNIFAEQGTLPSNYLYLISQRAAIYYQLPEIEYTINGGTNRREAVPSAKLKVSPTRYSQMDDLYKILDDPFNTTKRTSPLTTITGNSIFVYSDKTFLVKEIIIDYLRVPKKLSLVTPTDNTTNESELPEHLHKEIIQLAVDMFLQNTRELKQRLQRETPTSQQQNIEEQ